MIKKEKRLFFYNRGKKRRAEKRIRLEGKEPTEENVLAEYKKLGGKYEYQEISVVKEVPKKRVKRTIKKKKPKKKKK